MSQEANVGGPGFGDNRVRVRGIAEPLPSMSAEGLVQALLRTFTPGAALQFMNDAYAAWWQVAGGPGLCSQDRGLAESVLAASAHAAYLMNVIYLLQVERDRAEG